MENPPETNSWCGSVAARVEDVCMNAWPALQEIHYDGWLIRLAGGHTRRVNSVNVLRKGSLLFSEKIAYCEDVYRRHALHPYFRILSTTGRALEDALDARGYSAEDETTTLFMDFNEFPPPSPDRDVEMKFNAPDADWIAAYTQLHELALHDAARLAKILHQIAVPGVYAALRDESNGIRSLAKGAVHDRIVCINMVATDGAVRRRGYSRACVSAILRWAQSEFGAEGACLQVLADNTPAIRMYEGLGFVHELYHYHYRTRAFA